MLVERRLIIDAEPDEVWSVLVDVERWPEWTDSMDRVERLDEGEFGLGSRVRIAQPRLPRATWEVTAFEPGRAFRWVSGSPGAVSMADHEIEAHPDGGTELYLRFEQTGALARLVGPLFKGLVRRYVDMEAEGLKARCESGGGDPVAVAGSW